MFEPKILYNIPVRPTSRFLLFRFTEPTADEKKSGGDDNPSPPHGRLSCLLVSPLGTRIRVGEERLIRLSELISKLALDRVTAKNRIHYISGQSLGILGSRYQ